jgi:hypothetical protein
VSVDTTVTVVEFADERPISGFDTTIFHMDREFYATIDGEPALRMQPFMRWLRSIALREATRMGEVLHHADFALTTSLATIESWGLMHDCDRCRAAVQDAIRLLQADPDKELIVGQLYWAGR